jgi:hypothetical protein
VALNTAQQRCAFRPSEVSHPKLHHASGCSEGALPPKPAIWCMLPDGRPFEVFGLFDRGTQAALRVEEMYLW